MKLILLEWEPYSRNYRTIRCFGYNGRTYVPGEYIPQSVVWMMKRDEAEKRELIKEIEESIKYEAS